MKMQLNSKSTILLTGLLTGTLDGLSAIILNPAIPAANIFKFIASGLFGKAALSAGMEMVVYGVLLHYLISFIFCVVLLRIYPSFIKWFKYNFIIVFVYGLLIWTIMNLVVLPLSGIGPTAFHFVSVFKNMMALIVAFGLPIVWIASVIYNRKADVNEHNAKL